MCFLLLLMVSHNGLLLKLTTVSLILIHDALLISLSGLARLSARVTFPHYFYHSHHCYGFSPPLPFLTTRSPRSPRSPATITKCQGHQSPNRGPHRYWTPNFLCYIFLPLSAVSMKTRSLILRRIYSIVVFRDSLLMIGSSRLQVDCKLKSKCTQSRI